jgi:hypothetical protein
MKQGGQEIPFSSNIGFMYLHFGDSATANRHFEEVRMRLHENIDAGCVYASNGEMHLNLACNYSVMGEYDRALEELRFYRRFEGCPLWVIITLKDNPLIDNIREIPEFKALQAELEGKFNREKEKVRKVLVREGILM